jgi:DNA-binding transcriptional MerR regulator
VTDDLLSIGRFAKATGLTIDTLRHWDAEGLLIPASVDSATGYRRYRPDQVTQARAIAALRELELSVPAVRALLEANDAGDRAAILAQEKTRLEARTARLQRALHRLSVVALSASASPPTPSTPTTPTRGPGATIPDAAAPEKEIHVPTPPPPPTLDPATHRALGAGLFNRTWDLLETEDRALAQNDEMIDTAHASAHHWRQVGNTANAARGHWMLARVYATLGRGEPALHHARRCVAVLEAGGEGIEDWDFPAAAEAMARALAVSGDLAGAAEWKARAAEAASTIAEEGDRKVIEGDLATLPV